MPDALLLVAELRLIRDDRPGQLAPDVARDVRAKARALAVPTPLIGGGPAASTLLAPADGTRDSRRARLAPRQKCRPVPKLSRWPASPAPLAAE